QHLRAAPIGAITWLCHACLSARIAPPDMALVLAGFPSLPEFQSLTGLGPPIWLSFVRSGSADSDPARTEPPISHSLCVWAPPAREPGPTVALFPSPPITAPSMALLHILAADQRTF